MFWRKKQLETEEYRKLYDKYLELFTNLKELEVKFDNIEMSLKVIQRKINSKIFREAPTDEKNDDAYNGVLLKEKWTI